MLGSNFCTLHSVRSILWWSSLNVYYFNACNLPDDIYHMVIISRIEPQSNYKEQDYQGE
jgi:hypothetical protein